MATLTVQRPGLAGAAVTLAAADAADDSFANDGKTLVKVANGGGAPITVTIPRAANCNQGFSHSQQVTVAAGADKVIGPFPRKEFSSPVTVQYSAVTSVTVGAFKL